MKGLMYSIEAPLYMATVTRTFLCENEKLCKFILSHSFFLFVK